jgi:hypothetical protein
MPEFEMPAEVDAPPRPEQRPQPTTERPQHTAEPDASDALESPRRAGLSWRHVLIGAVVGAIVGAAIPGGIQVAERAAATADETSLRTAVTEYLTAIADGGAVEATRLVPLPSEAGDVTDAMLASAEAIDEISVPFVQVDGDVGAVEVRYSVGAVEVQRTLDAERVAGAWWVTTSLAEPVEPTYWGNMTDVTIGGTALVPGGSTYLYPGLYEIDEVDGPIMRVRGERFAVDGDPGSPTEAIVQAEVMPDVARTAAEVAQVVARMCQAEQTCPIPPEAELLGAEAYVWASSPEEVELSVQLQIDETQWQEVRVRIETDQQGRPSAWFCGQPGAYATPVDPCPAVE